VLSLLLIVMELSLLAAAQLAAGPPWTVLTAVALVLQSLAGLTLTGLTRLTLAFGWLLAFVVTGNRELFFCFAMTLAAHATVLFTGRVTESGGTVRWRSGAAAGGLLALAFLSFRVAQNATLKVLAVEAAVAIAILTGCLLAVRVLTKLPPVDEPSDNKPTINARTRQATGEAAIVIAAAVAAYAGLAI
jgi:hypothetical protein